MHLPFSHGLKFPLILMREGRLCNYLGHFANCLANSGAIPKVLRTCSRVLAHPAADSCVRPARSEHTSRRSFVFQEFYQAELDSEQHICFFTSIVEAYVLIYRMKKVVTVYPRPMSPLSNGKLSGL